MLTAVPLIRSPIVVAVVDAVADIILCNAAPIVTGELRTGVTGSEQAAQFITIISTVIVMVTAVVVGNATTVPTGKR